MVFEEPSGAGCIPGGDWPCGLSGGAPPVPVSIGPVQPCGCFWPFVSGVWVRPVLYTDLSVFESSACTEVAKLAIQIGKIAMYAKRIRCPRTLSGQHGAAPSVPERVAKGYRQDDVRFAPESRHSALQMECPLSANSGHCVVYSITSSARATTDCGLVMPSALAVLRLITSSYLVGACTGRLASFSPLRMRST